MQTIYHLPLTHTHNAFCGSRPAECGAGALQETNRSLGCNRTGAESGKRDINLWKTWTLDRAGPPCGTGSTMRTARVGAKARAGVDSGPGDISRRHRRGAQIQPGAGELVQSSPAPPVQSGGKVIQSNQALVQPTGLLVRGRAGLQVRVAVIKRTRLDPLPSEGRLAVTTVTKPTNPFSKQLLSQGSGSVCGLGAHPNLCSLK